MKNINKNDIEYLIDCLKNGKEIPLEYKYALFPTKQKEYELIYAGKSRKEDILADNEEAKAVPLQIEKVFNGSKDPERRFVEAIVNPKVAESIDAWVKSRDQNFYSIEYSWRKGEHPTQGHFNPDFFMKFGNNIVVVEIKADGDDSDENKAKLKWAKEHFQILNEELKKNSIKQKYFFHFLSPASYFEFTQYMLDGRLLKGEFRSSIEDLLEK